MSTEEERSDYGDSDVSEEEEEYEEIELEEVYPEPPQLSPQNINDEEIPAPGCSTSTSQAAYSSFRRKPNPSDSEDEEDDTDFDPASSFNTTQENVTEEDSDDDESTSFLDEGLSTETSIISSRKRPSSVSIDEMSSSSNYNGTKQLKLIPVKSNCSASTSQSKKRKTSSDEEEEDNDLDFDPTSSTNTPQENVSEDDESEDEDEDKSLAEDSSLAPSKIGSEERQSTASLDEMSSSSNNSNMKELKFPEPSPSCSTSTPQTKKRKASSSDEEDEEDDPDFDPSSTNTPQENVSEEDSDGEDEDKSFVADGLSKTPSKIKSRGRPSSGSIGEMSRSSNSKSHKELKLISVNSSQEMHLPPGIPKTRITFLSGKASDIGLTGLFKKGVGGGLSGVLAALRSKKQSKLTTLEKSRLDWQSFKQAEGLEDELKNQLKSRNGFLEKRDFLERSDHRQFEIEKNMRAKQRRNPLGS